MARKTSRRGGAWYDPRSWFTKSPEQKAKECAAKKADYDKECGPGEASASDAAPASNASAEMAGAPTSNAAPTLGGRSRRRRQTRRKYKSGKHRRSH